MNKERIIFAVIGCILGTCVGYVIGAQATRTDPNRFVKTTRPWMMFDNKTAQNCNAGSIDHDSLTRIQDDLRHAVIGRSEELLFQPTDSEVFKQDIWAHLDRPGYEEFAARYYALRASPPNSPPVLHFEGMPYCSELK